MVSSIVRELVRDASDAIGNVAMKTSLWFRETSAGRLEQFNARAQARIEEMFRQRYGIEMAGEEKPIPTKMELDRQLSQAKDIHEKRRILDDVADRVLADLKKRV